MKLGLESPELAALPGVWYRSVLASGCYPLVNNFAAFAFLQPLCGNLGSSSWEVIKGLDFRAPGHLALSAPGMKKWNISFFCSSFLSALNSLQVLLFRRPFSELLSYI